MRCPAELYAASARPYHGLLELEYSFHDRYILVTACGPIGIKKKIQYLAGQKLGIKDVDEGIWRVSFMHYDLGSIDLTDGGCSFLWGNSPFHYRSRISSQATCQCQATSASLG